MDWPDSERDNDGGKERGEFGRRRRGIDDRAGHLILPGTKLLGDWHEGRLFEPDRQTTVAHGPEVRSANRLGTQHGGSQLLVVAGGACWGGHEVGLSDFFLRASARSKLRRCTLTPNCASMAT